MASEQQQQSQSSSRSCSVTETVNGSHHFTINGYSLAKGMGVGKFISSQMFTVGGYQWAIYFHPDGENTEDNALYVSVFITLASEGTDVEALFEITLLDQSGKDKHEVYNHFDRGPMMLKCRGSMWGDKRFLSRAILETSDYLKDDSLSITCTVRVVISSVSPEQQQQSQSSSRSRSVTETVNGSHHFTINGYSLAKGMGVDKFISSQTFTVGGYQWAIYFYPDGKNTEDNSLYVSVFIALASEGTDVRALFELKLLDQSGKDKHKVHSHFDRSLESGPYTLKYRGSMWGYKRFFRRAILETSDYLKDDSLSITCTVGVVISSVQTLRRQSLPVPESNIGQHFGALLDSAEGADTTFEVDGETFRAHKLILGVRSPVFHAQLYGPLRDKSDDVLKLEDIEAPVFKAMLHFIYRDCLPDSLDSTSSSSSSSTLMAQHLLAAADRYGLDRLRVICEAKLCEDVCVETVATTLALAEQHHASQLKNVCLKFAASNLAAVMQTEGFDYLRESCPSLQSELLKTVAGMAETEEDSKPGLKHKAVWQYLGEGTDTAGRRVRQKTKAD